MKRLFLAAALFLPLAALAATPITFPVNGGTGTGTKPTTNSVLIGNSSGVYDVKTLTAGTNVTISNSGSTVTISASSGGGAGNSFGKAFEINAAGYLAPTTTITTLFNNGFVSQASSTIVGNATTTGMQGVGSLFINGSRFTGLLGSGLSNTGGALTVSGLTTSNFTSPNVSQFTNDAGYLTSAATSTLSNNNTFSGTNTFSNSIIGSITGNAGTATKLFTARNINGVSFDGTGAITIQAASSTALGDNNTWGGNNVFSNLITGSVSGNAATATKLATTRAINGVNFDGSAAITIFAASSTALGDNNAFSGVDSFTNSSSNFGGTWQTFAPSHFSTFAYPFTSNATNTNITFSGGLTGTLTGNASTATALAANGTNCSAGNYPLGVDASGNAESCTAAPTGTLTSLSVATANGFAGSSSGGATPAITLTTTITGLLKGNGTAISAAALTDFPAIAANTVLANNTAGSAAPTAVATSSLFQNASGTNSGLLTSTDWTTFNNKSGFAWPFTIAANGGVSTSTLMQFLGNASSTQLSVPNQAWFGSTATSTFNSAGSLGIASTSPAFPLSVNNAGSDFYVKTTGEVVGRDTTNAFIGRISPTHSFALTTGTTTAWTASTTNTAYSPYLVMPFSGTLKQVYCSTDTSFLGVNVQVAGANATPSYFVASTTVGNILLTAGNTFTKGQKVLMNAGTTTTASTQELSCSFDVTETP